MTNTNPTHSGKLESAKTELGTEEKAAFGAAGIAQLTDKRFFQLIWKTKLRLQFTGWLQYLPFGIAALVFTLAAALTRLLGSTLFAAVFLMMGTAALVVFTFDLITVKFRIRPAERLPRRLDDLDVFDLMRARVSCRSFQTRNLTPAHHAELMESVRLHREMPQHSSAPIRIEYLSAPLTVWPAVNANEFLVAIVPQEYDRQAVIEVGYTLQKIVIDATRMGLGTCWIGPGADHASIIQYMGERFDRENDHIVCVVAVGYPSKFTPMFLRIVNRQFKRRLPLSSLFFADDHFSEPLHVETPPFNQFGRSYEVCQWAPSSYNGQTTRCVAVLDPDESEQLPRIDFYASINSRYYAPVALGIWCANWETGCEALGIQGYFSVLPDKTRVQLPSYDVSWLPAGR